MGVSRYQKERAKYQQPTTDKPCLNCDGVKAENAHLIPWLALRRQGFPQNVINEDWNLVSLCRPCHWLYDDRKDIWVGFYLKQESVSQKREAVLEMFRLLLQQVNILAFPCDEPDDFPPHFGDIDDVDITWGEGTWLQTKIGSLHSDIGLEESQCEQAQVLWQKCLSQFKVTSSKEFQTKRKTLEQEFATKRTELLLLLDHKVKDAYAKANELAQAHLKFIELKVGALWSESIVITSFDVTTVRDGLVKVFLWHKDNFNQK